MNTDAFNASEEAFKKIPEIIRKLNEPGLTPSAKRKLMKEFKAYSEAFKKARLM